MRTDYITPELMYRLLGDMTEQNRLVLRFCLETGLRVSDVVEMPLTALHGTTVHYTAKKTKKEGKCTISTELFNDIMRHTDGTWVFPSDKSKTGHLTRQSVWKALKLASRRADIARNVAPHSARKIFAVQDMRKNGFAQAQKDLQHSRFDTTLLYCLSDTSFLDNADKMNKRIDGLYEILDNIQDMVERIADQLNIL